MAPDLVTAVEVPSAPALVVGEAGLASTTIVPPCPGAPGQPPDTTADWYAWEGSAVRAAKVRGWSHRQNGTSGQDAYCVSSSDGGRLLLAVADGLGSHARSEVLADLAVAEVLRQLLKREQLEAATALVASVIATNAVLADHALVMLSDDERESALPDHGYFGAEGAARPGTTLVVAVVSARPEADGFDVVVAQVGDSTAWVLDPVAGWSVLGEGGEDRVVGNATRALPSGSVEVSPVRQHIGRGQSLFLMTDGLATAMGDGGGPVALALQDLWAGAPAVTDFVAHVSYARRSFNDDRAVVGLWA